VFFAFQIIFLHEATQKINMERTVKSKQMIYDDVWQMMNTKLFKFIFSVDKIMT